MAVPQLSKERLNIDCAAGRKSCPGKNCPGARGARQDLPRGGISCRVNAANFADHRLKR